jgi:long-chain acyl-CoA synthetase
MEAIRLAQLPAGVRPHLTYPEVPAYHFLFEQVAQNPDRTALIFQGRPTSYRELGTQIDAFAAALIRKGLQKGDRIAIMLPNLPQAVIAIYGAMRAGLTPALINPMYTPQEIQHALDESGAQAIVFLDLFWPRVAQVKAVPHRIWTGVQDALGFPLSFLYKLKAKPPKVPAAEAHHLKELLAAPTSGFTPVPVNPSQDAAVLIFTGGTTGLAKGVHLTHSNLIANLMQIIEWVPRERDQVDRVLLVLPVFHSFAFTAGLGYALACGSTAILMPKPDPDQTLKLVEKYKVTILPGVPTLYTSLLQHPRVSEFDLQSLRVCISGAAPLPVELLQRFETMTGARILEGYGLTETSPVTHCNPWNGQRIPGSVGLPLPDTEVRIVDLETGADLGPNQEGEVLIRGPQVMKGYWGRPAETEAVLKDGWLYTGDIGKVDENGYLYIVDRKKDLVISSGFNVYPREIDEVFYQHPAVLEACAIGVPDEYRGEAIKVFVVKRPGMEVTEQDLINHCRERLAAYKRPREVQFVDSLPKSIIGKVLRKELRAQYLAEKAQV